VYVDVNVLMRVCGCECWCMRVYVDACECIFRMCVCCCVYACACILVWIYWWMDGWFDGWMDGLMDGWMDVYFKLTLYQHVTTIVLSSWSLYRCQEDSVVQEKVSCGRSLMWCSMCSDVLWHNISDVMWSWTEHIVLYSNWTVNKYTITKKPNCPMFALIVRHSQLQSLI
jgi:hypothetical protein